MSNKKTAAGQENLAPYFRFSRKHEKKDGLSTPLIVTINYYIYLQIQLFHATETEKIPGPNNCGVTGAPHRYMWEAATNPRAPHLTV
ncbi:MAG: hypothetical protein LBB66_07145 [Desulfovibrio sp.]|nr:hypothetical protein [Desulfovibrio sp.]